MSILDSIRTHIKAKLNKLCVVYAYKKNINKKNNFRYYKIKLYNLKSEEIFFKLLKEDIIQLEIISRISKSGIKQGQYKNKNIVFNINKDDLESLFNPVYSNNIDLNEEITY